MKVCSWDVGIKNLAYAIIDYNFETKKLKMFYWGIINISNAADVVQNKCDGHLKSGKACEKPEMYHSARTGKGYCKSHRNQYIKLEKEWPIKCFDPAVNINQCSYILPNKGTRCTAKSKYCIVNDNDNSLCTTHYKRLISSINKTDKLTKVKKDNASDTTHFDLCKNLISKLDALPELLDVDEVLIENQPSLLNPKMKTIASFLYSYFVTRGISDNKSKDLSAVRFISPSNKLKVNEDHSVSILSGAKDDKKYKLTKQLSVQYTKQLLSKETEWLNHLDSYKKKDDLCDAFLQGYHYLYFRASNNKNTEKKEIKETNTDLMEEKIQKLLKPKTIKITI